MMLPDGLVWIMEKLGFEWPDLDEDEIRRGAVLLRQYVEDLSATIDTVDQRMNVHVAEASTSKAALAFIDGWNQTRSQHLQRLVDVGDPAASGVDIFADAVLALKIKVIADVTLTAAQVSAAIASAFVTFGAGAAAGAALLLARKAALNIAVDMAVEGLMEQVLPLVIEPLTEVVPGVVNAVLEAPMVTGAVGELGEFTADLGALKEVAADLGTAATDLETRTAEFISAITSLNISGS